MYLLLKDIWLKFQWKPCRVLKAPLSFIHTWALCFTDYLIVWIIAQKEIAGRFFLLQIHNTIRNSFIFTTAYLDTFTWNLATFSSQHCIILHSETLKSTFSSFFLASIEIYIIQPYTVKNCNFTVLFILQKFHIFLKYRNSLQIYKVGVK